MYLLTHSLSPVLVLVAVMDPKVLKTKISHTHSLILSLHIPHFHTEEEHQAPVLQFQNNQTALSSLALENQFQWRI